MLLNTDKVLFSKVASVAYVTINRPDVLNALDSEVHVALSQIWSMIKKDDEIRVVVLAGSGGKAFSVGQDLKETAQQGKGTNPMTYGSYGKPGHPRLTQRFDINKPIIAKVEGYALGGGFELALACDIVIASNTTVFALPEAKRGMVPGAGGVFRLMRHIPSKLAMGYLLTGKQISAMKALEFGLVNEVTEKEHLDATVQAWINAILECSPLAIASIKEAAYKSVDLTMADSFSEKYDAELLRLQGTDHIEGPLAFVEKRYPNWCKTEELVSD